MLERSAIVASADAVDEAKTYLRIEHAEDDGLIGALVAGAIVQCEAFVGTVLLARGMSETLAVSREWQWLGAMPVRSVTSVDAVAIGGARTALAGGDYEIDIDADMRGRVRLLVPLSEKRIVVDYAAGSALSWNAIGDGLRRGCVRLAGHYHVHRERADELGPPAAVAALWRPSRRMHL